MHTGLFTPRQLLTKPTPQPGHFAGGLTKGAYKLI